jgi:hypothetical protein
MPTLVNCPYFYSDYHRGRDFETCRLVERNRENRRPWRRGLCASCPVPATLRQTTCKHLALEASVVRKFGLFDRVTVYAVCTEHVAELKDPKRCPECEAGVKKNE